MNTQDTNKELVGLSKRVRKDVLGMVHGAKASHVGSALSIVDLLVVLYKSFLYIDPNNPTDPKRDRFLLSKGHACTALYATLAELGYFNRELLSDYSKDGSIFMSHINSEVPGVEFSTGSLGHALPVGLGMALAAKTRGQGWKTAVLLSDGELNEGSNWEAFLMAPNLKLSNLYVLIDCNKLQAMGFTKDIIAMEPLEKKFEDFGWEVARVDGHNFSLLNESLKKLDKHKDKPKLLIADTIKGKGISFMENKLAWHYRSPSDEELKQGSAEIEAQK